MQAQAVGGRADQGEDERAVAQQAHFVEVQRRFLPDAELNAVFDAAAGAVVFRRGREAFPAHRFVAGKAAFLVEHVEVFADALADASRVDGDVVIDVARRTVAELGEDAAVAAIGQGDGDDVVNAAEVFVDKALFFAFA